MYPQWTILALEPVALTCHEDLLEILKIAFAESGVDLDACATERRGDRTVVLVPPEIPASRLADQLPGRLVVTIRRHNSGSAGAAIKLRVGLHLGDTPSDHVVADALRMLDLPATRTALRRPDDIVALVASSALHREVISTDPGLVPETYQRVADVWLRVLGAPCGPSGPRFFDVFIAHSTDDRPAVLELCRALRRHGVTPWVDVEQIQPGTWIQDGMEAAIRSVRTAAVLLGPRGIGPWQRIEIRAFTERWVEEGIPVIPVLLPGRPRLPTELLFLRQLNLVHFEQTVTEDAPLRRLIWGITGERPLVAARPETEP